MLQLPFAALCANRSVQPKQHSSSGSPENWLNNLVLAEQHLKGCSFDFFVNWQDRTLTPEIWVKRIVIDSYAPWIQRDKDELQRQLEASEGEGLKDLAQFASRNKLTLRYILFKESSSWDDNSRIVAVSITQNGDIGDVHDITLRQFKAAIRAKSGGAVRVGIKGLIYGTSTLECYLSKTDSAYPGDVDLILVNNSDEPVAIIEYKKHTLNTPIEDQQLQNYYPQRDGRKYDRLAVLRNSFVREAPIIVVYYPTISTIKNLKIEKIVGDVGVLRSDLSVLLPVPEASDVNAHRSILSEILQLTR